MGLIEDIRRKVSGDDFEYSEHAVEQALVRQIDVQELREAIGVAELIKDYPRDKYGPSCLLLGVTSRGRPLHIQYSYPSRYRLKIITVYEPDPEEWIDFRKRRVER
jgi:hypothetical protein